MDTTVVSPVSSSPAFVRLRFLIAAYVTLCVLTVAGEAVGASVLGADVGTPAWTRTAILVVVALVAALLTRSTGRGSARAFLRLRLVTAAQTIATVVIVALPGGFPGWLRIEQGLCALVLLAIVVVANGRELCATVAARAAAR